MRRFVLAVFPHLSALPQIQEYRRRWDPIGAFVAPHVTIVHPFEAEMTDDNLRSHMADALFGYSAFRVAVGGIATHAGEYVFLGIGHGSALLMELRNRLQQGFLAPQRYHGDVYVPHITLARVASPGELREALRLAQNLRFSEEEVTVHEVAAYEVLTGGARPIILRVPLTRPDNSTEPPLESTPRTIGDG